MVSRTSGLESTQERKDIAHAHHVDHTQHRGAIGRHTRLYFAYITTAPAALDAPSTMTLYAAPLADVSGLALDEIVFDACRARTTARLILVDATERFWQKRRCREHEHVFASADPVLMGLNTLQHWLWQRLGAPLEGEQAPLAHV